MKSNDIAPQHYFDIQKKEIDLKQIISIIKVNWKKIILGALIGVLLATAYAVRITPLYMSTTLIQVDNTNSSDSMLNNISMIGGQTQKPPVIDKEVALIKSRFVLTPVVESLRLNISATPKYFPIFGRALARIHEKKHTAIATPFLGLTRYAWGGEHIQVDSFSAPEDTYRQPYTLTVIDDQHYSLSFKGKHVLDATVGQTTTGMNEGYGAVTIRIMQLHARQKTEFTLQTESPMSSIKSLSSQLTITDQGKNENTGVLQLALTLPNPALAKNILNLITQTAQSKNIQQKTVSATQSLHFLKQQLPILKKSLNQSETALNDYRAQTGNIDLSFTAQNLLEGLNESEANQSTLKINKARLLQNFTKQHPTIIGINQQIATQEKIARSLKEKIKMLPKTDQKAVSLMRDVKVKSKLYAGLLAKMQEYQVIEGGSTGDVQILNSATFTQTPLPVHRAKIILMGLFLGAFIVVGWSLGYVLLLSGDVDPEKIESATGLPVLTVIPHSLEHEKQQQTAKRLNQTYPLLYNTHPKKPSIESLRSLRTMLQLQLLERGGKIISILGASPGIGKSFTAINLALVATESYERVLLIETDLRKGAIKKHLKNPNPLGLSEYLSSNTLEPQAILTPMNKQLDSILCGNYPKNSSQLLASPRYDTLIDWAQNQYDLILIDNPPILAVTDSTVSSKRADYNILLAALGKNTAEEIKIAIKRYKNSGMQVHGIICNHSNQNVATLSQNSYYSYDYEEETP